MKKAIYNGVKNVEVVECNLPEIDDNGVLVENICASICGSDVHAYYDDGSFAGIFPGNEFGHEMISRVVKVGKNVTDVQVGQRLYPFPLFAKADLARAGTVGGYSQYIDMPQFRWGMSAFKVADSISDEAGCLIEPLTVGWHAAKLANPTPEKNAVVFGAGTIGITTAVALRKLGIKDLIITDISPLRLEIAKELGFKTCNVAQTDLERFAKTEFGDARGKINADCFVDCAGVKSNLDFFTDNAKMGATLVVAAVYHQPVAINWMKVTFGQLHIVGSPAYDMTDVAAVLDMLENDNPGIEKIITHKYPVENITEALEKAGNAKESLKVIIDYRK